MDEKFEINQMKWLSVKMKLFILIRKLYRPPKRLCLVTIAVLALTWFYWFLCREEPPVQDQKACDQRMKVHLHELVLSQKGSGCVLPELDPFSEEALRFTRSVDNVHCDGEDWVECFHSECKPIQRIQAQMKDLVCTYRDILYVTDLKSHIAEPVKVYGGDTYVLNRSDHVKVSCTGTDISGLHLMSSRWFGYKIGFRPVLRPAPRGSELNVMIVLLESTSRNGFMRRMPKSHKYLLSNLNTVIMKSYNVVGDNSAAALYPMLTGHWELELPNTRRSRKNKICIDVRNFIFHHLKEKGYRTMYLEDMTWLGTFQWAFNGFEEQPADHYGRHFFREESKDGFSWLRGPDKRHCVGAIPRHLLMLNTASQFHELPGSKFSLTFLVSISHNDYNMISVADDHLVEFLKKYRDMYMDNTVLIVMGDHGIRYDSIRNTYQGNIEARLPFVGIVLPHKLTSSRPDALSNLASNVKVLTTHFDMHTTLLDILELKDIRNRFVVPGADMERGLSLLKPIPKSRSCPEAGILPHWCACTKWYNVTTSDSMYKRAALVLANYINDTTADLRTECASRTLTSIEWVLRQFPNDGKIDTKKDRLNNDRVGNEYFQAKIIMEPGHAIFEGTIQYHISDGTFVANSQDISRVNAYGDESECVMDFYPHLRQYCYCHNDINVTIARQKKYI